MLSPHNGATDSTLIAMRQFTRCTSYQPHCEPLETFLVHRVICATRMYRGLIDDGMEGYGIDTSPHDQYDD
jgi:hypothetical protein